MGKFDGKSRFFDTPSPSMDSCTIDPANKGFVDEFAADLTSSARQLAKENSKAPARGYAKRHLE